MTQAPLPAPLASLGQTTGVSVASSLPHGRNLPLRPSPLFLQTWHLSDISSWAAERIELKFNVYVNLHVLVEIRGNSDESHLCSCSQEGIGKPRRGRRSACWRGLVARLELEKLLVEDGDPRPAAGIMRRGRRRKRLGPTMDNDKKEMPDNPTGASKIYHW